MATIQKFFPLILLFVLFLSACEKDDDKTFLFPGKSKLDFDYDVHLLELSLGNIADKTLNWTATAQDDFLVLDKTSGTLAAGAYQTLSIAPLRNKITGDSVQSSITFSSNVGQDIRIGVSIRNYPENKTRLSYSVRDMAFDKDKQVVYLLPDGGEYLEVFDLNEKAFRKIDLKWNSHSNNDFLQLMPDGKNLIISQYHSLFVLDLKSESIVYSHDFNKKIVSATGTPNQIIYITLETGNQNFFTLDLNTRNLVSQELNLNRIFIQAHPSWKYLYGVGYFEELMKIDIQGDTPQEIYSNNKYQEADRLWISDDGTRIITDDMQFIHINPNLAGYDVLETETISVSTYNAIHDFAGNTQNNEYYLIFKDSYYYEENTSLYACDQEMNALHKIIPEPFLVNNNSGGYESAKATPHFIFSNPTDNTLIVLTYGRVKSKRVYALEIIENSGRK